MPIQTPGPCTCGGRQAHHHGDIACWCPRCLAKPTSERCTHYAPHVPLALPTPPSTTSATRTERHVCGETHRTAEDRARAEVEAHVRRCGATGSTASEAVALLRLSSPAVQTALRALERASVIREAPDGRAIAGGVTESVWVAAGDDGDPASASDEPPFLWG